MVHEEVTYQIVQINNVIGICVLKGNYIDLRRCKYISSIYIYILGMNCFINEDRLTQIFSVINKVFWRYSSMASDPTSNFFRGSCLFCSCLVFFLGLLIWNTVRYYHMPFFLYNFLNFITYGFVHYFGNISVK